MTISNCRDKQLKKVTTLDILKKLKLWFHKTQFVSLYIAFEKSFFVALYTGHLGFDKTCFKIRWWHLSGFALKQLLLTSRSLLFSNLLFPCFLTPDIRNYIKRF